MILTWNGRSFTFLTDVLGVAPLGASSGDGNYFPLDHDEYVQIPGEAMVQKDGKWTETSWRFNEQYDPYCKKGSGFDFYGDFAKAIPTGNLDGVTDPKPVPLPGKAKIFFRPYATPVEVPNKEFDLWLCTGRVL